jgi:hypothetical protein
MALDRMTVVDLYDVPWHNLLNPYAEGLEDTVLEQELIRSVVEYAKEDRQTIIAPTFLQTRRDWPTPTAKGDQDLEIIIDNCSLTFSFFYNLDGRWGQHTMSGSSPLQHVTFRPFRRLGFAIWDTERMVGYGLLAPGRPWWSDKYILAWRSILGRDDIENVARMNRNDTMWT